MTCGSFTGLQTRLGFSTEQLAVEFRVEIGLVRRWSEGTVKPPIGVMRALELLADFSPRPSAKPAAPAAFTFIDLFAGIGGLRRGFEAAGGRCVFTSEWNEYSRRTYRANFPDDDHEIAGDIREIAASDIPKHDLLLAGFPCQPFSIAGVSKKNALGRKHGFRCEAQGTLFFDIARIIEHHRPRAFVLENVKNLVSHDKGQTFRVIHESLQNDLGYEVHTRVINARSFMLQSSASVSAEAGRMRSSRQYRRCASRVRKAPVNLSPYF